jgi:hypothetical protein
MRVVLVLARDPIVEALKMVINDEEIMTPYQYIENIVKNLLSHQSV